MLKNILSAFTIGTIVSSCRISADKPKPIPAEDTLRITSSLIEAATALPDTSNQYIYDFMKLVINERELNTSYGLDTEPALHCNNSLDDSVFLQSMLVEQKKTVPDSIDAGNVIVEINATPKCLTKSDVKYMLQQKKLLDSFKWNNARMGFNASNEKNWYCFSVPLFSKDRKKAVLMIERLCPGLCGVGNTVVFRMKNGKWYSVEAGWWIH